MPRTTKKKTLKKDKAKNNIIMYSNEQYDKKHYILAKFNTNNDTYYRDPYGFILDNSVKIVGYWNILDNGEYDYVFDIDVKQTTHRMIEQYKSWKHNNFNNGVKKYVHTI